MKESKSIGNGSWNVRAARSCTLLLRTFHDGAERMVRVQIVVLNSNSKRVDLEIILTHQVLS